MLPQPWHYPQQVGKARASGAGVQITGRQGLGLPATPGGRYRLRSRLGRRAKEFGDLRQPLGLRRPRKGQVLAVRLRLACKRRLKIVTCGHRGSFASVIHLRRREAPIEGNTQKSQ